MTGFKKMEVMYQKMDFLKVPKRLFGMLQQKDLDIKKKEEYGSYLDFEDINPIVAMCIVV